MVRRIALASIGLTAFVHGIAWACSCAGPVGGKISPEVVDAFDLVVWGVWPTREAEADDPSVVGLREAAG